jgi:hypothetical protein
MYGFKLRYSVLLLIQIFAGFLRNKNIFLNLIFKISGFNQLKEKSLSLALLLFICSIVFDRNSLVTNRDSILLDLIISKMYFKQIPSDDIFNSIPFEDRTNPALSSLLPTISTVHSYEKSHVFRLREKIQMNLYSPFINMSTKFSFLSKFIQTKRNQLLDQHHYESEPFNLQLFSIFTCSTMFQLYFRILCD